MALRLLLTVLGWTFIAASRWSPAFRSQLSRDVVIEIRSDDGVAHQFSFRGRRATAAAGRTAAADCALRFATAAQGFATLTAPDGPHRTMAGLLDGTITIEGRASLMPWFQGLVPAAIPGLPVLRLPATPPDPYLRPTSSAGWVDAAAIATLPRVAETPSAIVYGPLAEATAMPDVVLLRIDGRALMTLHGALPELRIEGRPQCHIVAIAKEAGEVAASVGCALSRARTGMKASEMTCAIPGPRLGEVIARLEATSTLDRQMARYAAADARRFA